MKENLLISKSKDFALKIIALCKDVKSQGSLTNQLLRSATSIGANLHEAQYAKSKNVELELIPIGREAFVFIVNSNNPINNLTIEQKVNCYIVKLSCTS